MGNFQCIHSKLFFLHECKRKIDLIARFRYRVKKLLLLHSREVFKLFRKGKKYFIDFFFADQISLFDNS